MGLIDKYLKIKGCVKIRRIPALNDKNTEINGKIRTTPPKKMQLQDPMYFESTIHV